MIERLELTNFKGFERFSVGFGEQAVLVGPNNAGKSTIIAALRACAGMLRIARSSVADTARAGAGDPAPVTAWTFDSERVGLIHENLRHEFRQLETFLRLRFRGGATLTAVWPAVDETNEEPAAFFVLRANDGVVMRRPAEVRRGFPTVAIVPPLTPVEHVERVLSDDHVRANMTGRLASRHFRNHLRLLQEAAPDEDSEDLNDFLEWATPWTPDFEVMDLGVRTVPGGRELDLYCKESHGRTPKELFWAGDGVQVWLQLLALIFRSRHQDTIVLDEPDLYLHADLQRRLIRLLEALPAQTIIASHSAELLTEAPPAAVTWIARERRRAVRAPDEQLLTVLSQAIGSRFNLRLARALRARSVVFVEGNDMRILRDIAATVGAERVATESDLAVVPLQGFSNWDRVEPFRWLLDEFLNAAVPVYVLLDRDYRTDMEVSNVVQRLKEVNVQSHVWRRKELESYLLEPEAIARLSGASISVVESAISVASDAQESFVSARQLSHRLQTEVTADRHQVKVVEAHNVAFSARWAEAESRPHLCDAKQILSDLNRTLQDQDFKAVTARRLARELMGSEVSDEMQTILLDIDQLGS